MAHSRWVLLLCAGATLGSACSISPTVGETAAECSDGRDNDDDGASDCEDPDCQALSECGAARRSGSLVPGHQIGDAYVGEAPDAGTSEPNEPPDVPDASDSGPEDAGAPVEPPDATLPGCGSGCGPDQTCVLDQCIDDVLVVFELWDVTEIEVAAPRSVEEGGVPCLDTTGCIFIPRGPFWSCGCEPDPQVQFWVDADPTDDVEAELAGETTVAVARDEYRWTDPAITLRLLPTSEIQMKMVDDDGTRDDPMFGCTIDASVVAAGGPMECTAQFPPGASDAVEFYIRAQVAPTQVPPE